MHFHDTKSDIYGCYLLQIGYYIRDIFLVLILGYFLLKSHSTNIIVFQDGISFTLDDCDTAQVVVELRINSKCYGDRWPSTKCGQDLLCFVCNCHELADYLKYYIIILGTRIGNLSIRVGSSFTRKNDWYKQYRGPFELSTTGLCRLVFRSILISSSIIISRLC